MLSKLIRILARETPQSKQWRLHSHKSSQNSSAPEVAKSITKGRKQVEIYPFYEYKVLNNKIDSVKYGSALELTWIEDHANIT